MTKNQRLLFKIKHKSRKLTPNNQVTTLKRMIKKKTLKRIWVENLLSCLIQLKIKILHQIKINLK